MLAFLVRTWFVWWAVAIVAVLRWHHVLVTGGQANIGEPEETEEMLAWPAESVLPATSE